MVIDFKDKGPSTDIGAPSLSGVSVGASEIIEALRSASPNPVRLRDYARSTSFGSEPNENVSADQTGLYADQRPVSRVPDRLGNQDFDHDQFEADNAAGTYLVFNGGKSSQTLPETSSEAGSGTDQVQRLVRSGSTTFLN